MAYNIACSMSNVLGNLSKSFDKCVRNLMRKASIIVAGCSKVAQGHWRTAFWDPERI